MITYRDAGADDLVAVNLLFRRSFVDTFGHLYHADDLDAFLGRFTRQAWAMELAEPDLAIRLAEEDGVLVGFAKVSDPTLPVDPVGKALELRQLYLDEAAKGRGVADALIDWTIAEARRRGAGELFLSVYVDNHRAKRFYARHGFVRIGAYAFMVGSHEDQDDILRLAL